MNRQDDLDRLLSSWLDDPLTLPAPHYLDDVLERTRRTRQRPAWASLERWIPVTTTLRNPVLPMPTRPFVIGLAVLLALLLALTSAPFLAGLLVSPSPDDASNGGLIAFDRRGDIFVVDPPDGEPRLLVGGPDEDVGPLWSPDGQHLLFFRIGEEGEVPMLTDETGTSPMELVREPLEGVTWVNWAPDSSAIVYSSEVGSIGEPGTTASVLSILPVDGSGDVQHLTIQPGPGADYPTWRPATDGSIELLYRQIGDPGELAYVRIGDDGGAGSVVLRVEDIEGKRDDRNGGLYDFLEAAWAPNGDRFAYHTLHDLESAPSDPGFRVHVAEFASQGTAGPIAQDDTMLEFDPIAADEGWPVWSSDGSRVAFQSFGQGSARLVIMPDPGAPEPGSDGGVVATVPFCCGTAGRLGYAWAPDGSAIVLVDFYVRSADHTTFLVDTATGELQAMDWKADSWPSWQHATSG